MTSPSNHIPTSRGKRWRAVLRHAALTRLPIQLSRGRLVQARSQQRLHVTETAVSLQNLHPDLHGLRITHVSDLHIGELIPVQRLPEIVRAVNGLNGDLIAVTGDVIDLHHGVLDDVIDALRQLRAPLGVYLVPGNHDYLHNGQAFIDRMLKAEMPLLINQHRRIARGSAAIDIAGIDYSNKRSRLDRYLRQTLEPLDRTTSDFRLLLSHHPHAFDHAPAHDVNLTLAGHTHGGHVRMPANRRTDSKKRLGLGNLSFRYPHGLYENAGSYLYVTSGLGSWFPLRINCPAEIAQITLTPAPGSNPPT